MHRLITLACMLIATILWIAGINTGSALFFATAAVFEIVFWARFSSRRT